MQKCKAFLLDEITTYIIFSLTLNKYYIGSTSDELKERIRKHNTNHKGFTGRIGDWEFKYCELFLTQSESLKRERQIKNWKSKIMIEKLIASSEHPD